MCRYGAEGATGENRNTEEERRALAALQSCESTATGKVWKIIERSAAVEMQVDRLTDATMLEYLEEKYRNKAMKSGHM